MFIVLKSRKKRNMRERKGIFTETGSQSMKQNTSSSKAELGKNGNELEEEEGMGRVVKQWND